MQCWHCGKCSRGNADWTYSKEKQEVRREELQGGTVSTSTVKYNKEKRGIEISGTTSRPSIMYKLYITIWSFSGKASFNTFFQWFSRQLLHWLSHLHKKYTHTTYIWNIDGLQSTLWYFSENKDNSWFTSWDIYIIRQLTHVSFGCKHVWNAWSHTNLQSVSHIAYMLF